MRFEGIPSKYCVLPTVENTSKVKAVVHGIIAGVPMPFPFPQPDACQNSGLACPLVSGQDYVYNTQIPISSSYPKVQITIVRSCFNLYILILFCLRSKFWSNGNCKKIMEKICSALKFLQPLCSYPSANAPQFFKKRREKYKQFIPLDCIFLTGNSKILSKINLSSKMFLQLVCINSQFHLVS
jgi:hypothetical protein